MRLIKKGCVDVLRVDENTQSYPDIAKMYRIDLNCWNPVCTIGGEDKIQIFLRDGDNPNGKTTILSTGDSWSKFNQDDAIKVVVKCREMEVILVYYNLRYMKRVYTNPTLTKACKRASKRKAQRNH